MFKKNKSLKDILIIHELAFILLILLAATAGGIGINLWQSLTQETQRISALVAEVQQTRGDLYRQMKELFDAFFLADTGARGEYDDFTIAVEKHFKKLNLMAENPEEKMAIADLHKNYRQFVQETTVLFEQKEALSSDENRVAIQHALNNGIEKGLFTQFEIILGRTEKLLADQQSVLNHRLEGIKSTSTILLIIPLILAVLLLVFSRTFLKRSIVSPINEVLKATSEISTGNLSFKASEEGVDELVAVSRSINQMADQLSIIQQTLVQTEKQAAQGLLVPMLAHNIRNPLASIRATAQILDTPEIDNDSRESLVGIIDTVDRLERWTGALLAYLHPLKPQLANSNLVNIVLGACSPLQQKIKERALTLILPTQKNISIMTDEHLLEQVIYNFVLNAVDASPKGSAIEISIIEQTDSYQLLILDNGSGMPFTPDPSAMNAPTTKRFGTGLGIPFGFKVCEALKSDLTFSQRNNGGTRLSIILPKKLNLTRN
jgi:nitrogen fixation/metabolism regulation signal transduction histidine kinase